MSSLRETIAARAAARVREFVPRLLVEVVPSHDDVDLLCVDVFGAGKGEVAKIEDFIFDLDDKLCEGTPYALLPMVKTLAVTRQYYPEEFRRLQERRARLSSESCSAAVGNAVPVRAETALRGSRQPVGRRQGLPARTPSRRKPAAPSSPTPRRVSLQKAATPAVGVV